MVIFGLVLQLRAIAAGDPVVTTGHGTIEVGTMLDGIVRPRSAASRPGTIWASAADSPDLHARQSVRALTPEPLIAAVSGPARPHGR